MLRTVSHRVNIGTHSTDLREKEWTLIFQGIGSDGLDRLFFLFPMWPPMPSSPYLGTFLVPM